MLIELTDEQKTAVDKSKKDCVLILTGGPGTGKTTTCKEIIRQAEEVGMNVALCAPSGKAAKRMTEATEHDASTIHKLLAATLEDGGFVFGFNENIQLLYDVIIVDETSMVSTDLMASLLRAVRVGTRLILVGDQDQLPSVGPGTVLKDLLASKQFSHVELTKIHRNAGDIVRACHNIKKGKGFSPHPTMNLEEGHNFRHFEKYNEKDVAATIVNLVTSKLPALGYDPLWEVQVISPFKEKSDLSCQELNLKLQAVLNPRKAADEKFPLKVGDKAIQIRNQKVNLYNGTITFDGMNYSSIGMKSFVVNGDICQILDITKSQIIARFFYPDRIVALSKVDHHLILAYAITCHRFQGSEAPVIVIPVHRSFGGFVNRPWIYTAISRAQILCITVGQLAAIEAAAKRRDSDVRLTRLLDKLRKGKCDAKDSVGDFDSI